MDQETQLNVVVNCESSHKKVEKEEEWKKEVEVTHKEVLRIDDPSNDITGPFKATEGVQIEGQDDHLNLQNDSNIHHAKSLQRITELDTMENKRNINDDEAAAAGAEASVIENFTDAPKSQLPQWERTVADFIMTSSGELEWPSSLGDGVRNSREAMDLASSVGRFTTACLFSKRFRLREIALEALMDQMTRLYPAAPVVIEGAVLRFFDMNGYGLQDAIPSVIAAACAFTRMVLADEHKCLPAVLVSLMNLLPRLLCCAADSHPRIRDEARRTLTLCVKTEAIPNATILLAVLADPVDKERLLWRSGSSISITPRVQVARLMLLEELITTGGMSTREYDKPLWNKFLLPCLNHHSQEVRSLATSVTAYLMRGRMTTLAPRRASKIYNITIRDHLMLVAGTVGQTS